MSGPFAEADGRGFASADGFAHGHRSGLKLSVLTM